MGAVKPSSIGFPHRLESPAGLRVEINANGSIRRMDHRDIMVNLFLGTEMEGGPANIFLRRLGKPTMFTPLLGPGSPASIGVNQTGMTAEGEWEGIRFLVSLRLAESAPAWFWHVSLENRGRIEETVDLIYSQDMGLALYGFLRINEYYVSHYVDHTPLAHPERGFVVASRQNLAMDGRHPWTVVGALGKGKGYSTDGLQFHGLETRAGGSPPGLLKGLPATRLQHEHSMVAIQETPFRLEPGKRAKGGFFGWFEEDHQGATSERDILFVDKALALAEAMPQTGCGSAGGVKSPPTLFGPASLLNALELKEFELAPLFGENLREVEMEEGKTLSFFSGLNRHVVLKIKESRVLRPHANILRTGSGLVPDEASLTSTAWMSGVFHSMVAQGHVSINRFLSATHSYLGLLRAHGQRVFVELGGAWRLLDLASAFEMGPQDCRWIYKHTGGMITVRSEAAAVRHELTLTLEVVSGSPMRFLVSNHVALNGDDGSNAVPARYTVDDSGVFVRPVQDSDVGRRFPDGRFRIEPYPGTVIEKMGGDELLFLDGRSRHLPYLCMISAPALSAGFRIKGCLVSEDQGVTGERSGGRFWTDITSGLRVKPPAESLFSKRVEGFTEILPWFIQNVLIHYLAPRGLEQYTGGGWGTRDICQGPLEMLLGLSRLDPVRDILIRVFSAQNPDGDWPQWFMFFDRERNLRAEESHGDIVFWPLLAVSQYLTTAEDMSFINEIVPFFHPEGEGKAEKGSIHQHLERALAVINNRVAPGTRLAAYGLGDWNDSMQPYDPAMRERLCSSWTVTLHYQTLKAMAVAMERIGFSDRAMKFEAMAAQVAEEFQRWLVVDGILTGFAYFREDGRVDYLLHPRDRVTGVSYSLLPMIHAVINGLLTPEQAKKHLDLIHVHLHGPDGARLFNRPMEYRGGVRKHFQRAESAAFFGREIGLMYTHAHLRYAEALARWGDAEGFFLALCRANPIDIRTLVPGATLRQANCYYSSSDAAFRDRYEAFSEYERVKRGDIPLDGGWRVYSSGPGIWTRLMMQNFLGLRKEKSLLVLDPVIPPSLDGLRTEMEWEGRVMEITYRVGNAGCGPVRAKLNGSLLPYTRGANPYRKGAAEVPMSAFRERLVSGINRLVVHIG